MCFDFELAGHQDVHHRVRFELRMSLSGLLLRAGRSEERERVPRESEGSAESGSGAFGASVRYDGHF